MKLSSSNGTTNGNGLNGNSFMSNILEPFQRPSITNSILSNFANFTIDDPSSLDFAFLGNNGNGNGNHGNGNGNAANRINSPSTSDSSNGSPRTTSCSNYSKCGHEAVNKCLNCTSVYCEYEKWLVFITIHSHIFFLFSTSILIAIRLSRLRLYQWACH